MRLKNIEKAMQSISSRRHVPKQISRNERHLLLCTTAIPDHIYSETPILPYNVDNHLFPSLEITLEIVDIYFTHLHIIAPVLDRGAFVQSIIHKTCSPFILYAMLAVAARYDDLFYYFTLYKHHYRFSKRPEVLEEPIWMSGEKYASRAREMIGDVIETACLDHIQGFLLLCFHEYGCDQAHRCWMYAGIAARMASQIELGTELMYNIEPGTVFSIKEWTDFETRRKVFWNIYINDK
jgi:hypothetical protein